MTDTVPNGGVIVDGQVWTASQWNNAWTAKIDATAGYSLNQTLDNPTINGATYSGSTVFSDLSTSASVAANSTASRTFAGRFSDIINVKDFGAIGDGIADDTVAINAAFAALRSATSPVSGVGPAAQLIFPRGTYKITGTINATSIKGMSVVIEGEGSVIDCQTSGKPGIDALDTRYITWRNLTISGNATNIPTFGIQIGKITSAAADCNHFSRVFFQGTFSIAGHYNRASETTTYDHLLCWNVSTASTAYCMVLDGYNHFNVTSAFVTTTLPVDSPISFNENVFINGDWRQGGGRPAMWMGAVNRHRWVSAYVGNTGSSSPATVIWFASGDSNANRLLDFDCHFETSSISDIFLISGTEANPVLNGFIYRDHANNATNSILKADVGISSVTIWASDFFLSKYNSTANFLDTPATFRVSGIYRSSTLTQFNATAWQGPMMSLGGVAFGAYGTSGVTAQIADATNVGGNTRGTNSVDFQSVRGDPTQVASGKSAIILGGENNRANGFIAIAGGSTNTAGNNAVVALGQQNQGTGQYSTMPGGLQASDRGRYGVHAFSSGRFSAFGDAQVCRFVLRGTGSTTSAIRLTSDGATASATNCVNMPTNCAFAIANLTIVAFDTSNVSNNISWSGWTGLMSRAVTGASTAVSMSATPTPQSNGTVTGNAISVTADTTFGGLNISFTPPTGNADTWHVVATIETVEVL